MQNGTLPDFLFGLSPIAESSPEVTHWAVEARLIGWRPVLAKSPLRHRYLQDLISMVVPPTSLLHPGRPLLDRDCLFVGKFPLISQLASISRVHSTIHHPWTHWVAVTALRIQIPFPDYPLSFPATSRPLSSAIPVPIS